MRFPADFGAHPDHRTEWWYVTGWIRRAGAPDAGFQLTFFRSRTAHPAANPSRFAPTQLVLAHAAARAFGARRLTESACMAAIARAPNPPPWTAPTSGGG